MRLLYINSILVDLDEEASIGIDFLTYDLKDPGRAKTKISNVFSIPKTSKNLSIFGFPDNPHSIGDEVYDKMTCDYYLDNFGIIKSGVVRIENISNRINLYVSGNITIWDELKTYLWSTFLTDYLTWVENEKGLTIRQEGNDNLETFLTPFTSATEHIFLPFYYGNRLLTSEEDADTIYLDRYLTSLGDDQSRKGGHFCIYFKSLFQFLEYKYSVNFCTGEAGLDGNIWDDAIAPTAFTPARDLGVAATYSDLPVEIDGYYLQDFSIANKPASTFYPYKNVQDKAGKTMYDMVKVFMQKFNCMFDEVVLSSGQIGIKLSRFDDIKTLAPVVDFSKNFVELTSIKFAIDGYTQNNYIKYKYKYKEADDYVGSRNVTCLNKNIGIKSDLLELDEYYPAFKSINNGLIPDLSVEESFKHFEVFVKGDLTALPITIVYEAINDGTPDQKLATIQLYMASVYSLAGEYTFLEEILEKPKVYTIKKWMTASEMFNLKYFEQKYIKELNGSFYINKVSGFNPQKSNEPTTIELIRISDKTPTPNFGVTDYYIDNDEEFIDGLGNFFY